MDNKQRMDFAALREWGDNPRNISEAALARLKKQLILKGFYKSSLVTPADDGSFIVLGGNQRRRVVREIIESTPEYIQQYVRDNFSYDITIENAQLLIDRLKSVPVTILEFHQKPEGYWVVTEDGKEQIQRFPSKKAAMTDWALSDNDEYGHTDKKKLEDLEVEIDWGMHAQAFMETPTVDEMLKDTPAEEKKEEDLGESDDQDEQMECQCPNCGTRFVAKDYEVKPEAEDTQVEVAA